MIGIAGTPSTALFSHNAGWTFVLKDIASREFGGEIEIIKHGIAIHDYDTIIINEGLNYKENSWNFFGGVQPDTIHKLVELGKYAGDVYCYNEKIEWSGLKKRKEIPDELVDKLPEVKLLNTQYVSNRIIIGDSHTVSIYDSAHSICRVDGATLHGALKEGGLLTSFGFDGYSDITIYLGNIDIRFHIHRNGGVAAVQKLCNDYIHYIDGLISKGLTVTVQGLLPIEDETRKIPGTGKYKGQAYYGSQQQREEYRYVFNSIMESSAGIGYTYRAWDLPDDGFAEPKFECMESRQSVHLKPKYYLNKQKFIK